MDKLIVTLIGGTGILLTFWYFFGKKEENVYVKGSAGIKVSGGYRPSRIIVKKNQPLEITFLRTDQNPCLEEVVIPGFKIKKFLPLNEKVSITIKPENAGEFPFACGMNMFHGKIIVQD